MLKKTGVYTVKCPDCLSLTLVHLTSDGAVSPNKCRQCNAEFEGIDKGEQPNSFVGIISKKESTIVVTGQAGARSGKKWRAKNQKKYFKTWGRS